MMKISVSSYLMLLLLIFGLSNGNAQDKKKNYVIADGRIEYHNRVPLEDAKLVLYENGKKVDSHRTDETGLYKFILDYNKEYMLEISKDGLISKKVLYNTKMPGGAKGGWGVGIPINLYEICKDMDASVFDKPVARVSFNAGKKEYYADPDYNDKVRAVFDAFEEKNMNCLDNEYFSKVEEADRLYKEKKYEEALILYEEAAQKRPWEYSVVDMVDIVKDDIKSQERRVRKEYDDLIKDADKAYDKEEYQKAKSLYQTALNKLPGEDHPENMLNRIRDIQDAVAEKKAEKLEQQNKYQQKIREADDLLEAGELTAARSAYLEARNVLPGKSYPSQKLEEIEELKREKKQAAVEKVKAEKENKYNNLIAQADELLDAKSYKKAKENYEKALNVFPDDPYAKNKLVLADRAIRKKIQEEQDRKASFEESVKKGDEYFAAKQYEMAKSEYLKAQDIKPGDPYLSEQVQNVNAELEKIARREEKAKLNKIAYDKAISQGDALVSSGDYQAAIDAYNRAVEIMPGEDLPRRKIDQTNKIILEQKKEQAFETLLAEGQSLIKQAKYEDALEKYQKAARMKPESSVPGKKMEEITSLIQDKKLAQKQREKEEKYQKLVADAEGFLQLDEYAMAKSALNEAIMLKPDDPVAKSKLEEINSELTAIEKEKEERQKLEKSYNEALKLASGYLKENELERSKEALKLALNYKPGDSYAREQLDRVEEKILRMEQEKAQQLAHEQQVQKALAKAEDLLAENKLNEAKNAFLKVLELEPNHQSASNDLKAINEKIAAVQARKMALQAEERKYKQLLENADKLLEKADYQSAKDLYSQAKEMKPDDSYPKNRIKQIDNILETLANAESKKELKKVDASTVTEAKLPKLEFRNNQERDKYLGELLEIFPPGITHEVYKSKKVTTHRYIIIRNNEAHELRSDLHYWGGSDYSRDGKPVTQQYFNSQIKQRKDEYYKKFIK